MVGAYSLRMGAFGADGVGPDGICIDAVGAVWTGSGENACVRVRAGGEVLQRSSSSGAHLRACFGGPDGGLWLARAVRCRPIWRAGSTTRPAISASATWPASWDAISRGGGQGMSASGSATRPPSGARSSPRCSTAIPPCLSGWATGRASLRPSGRIRQPTWIPAVIDCCPTSARCTGLALGPAGVYATQLGLVAINSSPQARGRAYGSRADLCGPKDRIRGARPR
jgi:hypothetical protein